MTETGPELHTMKVELIFDHDPEIDPTEIEALTRRASQSACLVDESSQVVISHDEFTHDYDDGVTASIKTAILSINESEPESRDLSQTWDFPDAEQTLGAATSTLLVSEFFGMTQSPTNRITAFSAVLRAAIESLEPIAVWSPHSQRLLRPETILENQLWAFVNVRMYNIEGPEEAILMDTLGLHALRLPDIQCHFNQLDPAGVAKVLYNLSAYIAEQGDIIEDGNTISGISDADKWRCQHEMALLPPERLILDINPGHPHAAGNRGRPS